MVNFQKINKRAGCNKAVQVGNFQKFIDNKTEHTVQSYAAG